MPLGIIGAQAATTRAPLVRPVRRKKSRRVNGVVRIIQVPPPWMKLEKDTVLIRKPLWKTGGQQKNAAPQPIFG
jgi:hypothetical protein